MLVVFVAGDGHMVLRQALLPESAGEHGQTHDHAERHRGAGVHPLPGALRGLVQIDTGRISSN